MGLVLGGTVYTFSSLLAELLAGLGLGSGLASGWSLTHRNPRLAITWVQLGLVAGIAWAAWMIPETLPHWSVNSSVSARILDEIVAHRRYPVSLFGSDESHRRRITDSWKPTPIHGP